MNLSSSNTDWNEARFELSLLLFEFPQLRCASRAVEDRREEHQNADFHEDFDAVREVEHFHVFTKRNDQHRNQAEEQTDTSNRTENQKCWTLTLQETGELQSRERCRESEHAHDQRRHRPVGHHAPESIMNQMNRGAVRETSRVN